MKIRKFTDLKVWHNSVDFSLEIYKITKNFPKSEIFGIISQLRRAAYSIGANIAEGFGRYYFKDKIRFYYQARGSATEAQHFLILSLKIGFINKKEFVELYKDIERIRRGIVGLIRSINKNKE